MPMPYCRSALLVAGLGLLASPAWPQGNDPSFRLTNNGASAIVELYVSPSSNQNWGPDRLGVHSLAVGESFDLHLPEGQCMNDIRVVWNNGQNRERRQLNTCAVSQVSFP